MVKTQTGRRFAPVLGGGRSTLLTAKKEAFTLAEVLITLAIIGVVATMTIPKLIADFQKKSTAIKVKKAYAELIQAIKLSEIDNGDFSTWNLGSQNSIENSRKVINKYITPYYNSIWECGNGIGNEENSKNEKYCKVGVSSAGVNYALSNGTVLSFLADASVTKVNFIPVIVITNTNEDYKQGKSYFYFQINNGKVEPIFWRNGITRDDILNGFVSSLDDTIEYKVSCKNSIDGNSTNGDGLEELHRHGCTALLYLDGFEFKDDYPW